MTDTRASARTLSYESGYINDLGVCWVCDSPNSLEGHHMIPRAYGGEHGPQVVICASCHGGVHALADADLDAAKLFETFTGLPNEALTRAHTLAKIVVVAREAVKDDPNKSVVFQDRFPAKTKQQLRDLARALGTNQRLVVRRAIAELHKRFFG